MAPILGYWSLRGLGQVPRDILHYTGTEFVDQQYTVGEGPTYNKDEWTSVKETLGLEFPNLPYYIDGTTKITESSAILRHLARQHGLYGDTEQDRIRVDVSYGVIYDVVLPVIMLSYNADFDTLKGPVIENIAQPLGKLSTLVGDKDYILGSNISLADFLLFETLERFVDFVPNCLEACPKLAAFHQRFSQLPNIKKYRESPEFLKIKSRFNSRMAKCGAGTY